jgi:hypothetical protein
VKKPNPLLKVVVVASSVLLAGGFVGYRAGAFDWLRAADEGPVNSESGSAGEPVFLPGSKVMGLSQEPAAWQAWPTIMGGSKYKAPLVNPLAPDTSAPAQQPPPPAAPPASMIMSGSKSFVPLVEPTAPGTAVPPPVSVSQPSKPTP